MPLVSSFWLSKRKGSKAWVEPKVDAFSKSVSYEVKTGEGSPPPVPKIGRGAKFRCLVCGESASDVSTRGQFQAKLNSQQLMAVIAEGTKGRIYLPPSDEQIAIALSAVPKWKPEEEMNPDTPNLVSGRGYGFTYWHELFTSRQMVALTTFVDLVGVVHEQVLRDARLAGWPDDGETGAVSYADAMSTYLGLSISKAADLASTICHWQPNPEHLKIAPTFARHAIPMSWDFAEGNPFSDSSGNFTR
jgi:putative DNA methylase